jgi:hypothetical protein
MTSNALPLHIPRLAVLGERSGCLLSGCLEFVPRPKGKMHSYSIIEPAVCLSTVNTFLRNAREQNGALTETGVEL